MHTLCPLLTGVPTCALPILLPCSPIGVMVESIDSPHGDHVERMAAATAVSDARVTIRGVMRRCLRASANPPMVGTSSRAVAALPPRSLRAMAADANIPEQNGRANG